MRGISQSNGNLSLKQVHVNTPPSVEMSFSISRYCVIGNACGVPTSKQTIVT
jgi:hypothetical protein